MQSGPLDRNVARDRTDVQLSSIRDLERRRDDHHRDTTGAVCTAAGYRTQVLCRRLEGKRSPRRCGDAEATWKRGPTA